MSTKKYQFDIGEAPQDIKVTIDFETMTINWNGKIGEKIYDGGMTDTDDQQKLLLALYNAGYYKGPDTIKKLEKAISIAKNKDNKDENLISNLQSVLKKEQDKDKKDKNSISNLQSHLKKEQDTNKNLSTLNIALIITSSVLFIALLISLFLKGKKGKK
jgi:hypothetical protein